MGHHSAVVDLGVVGNIVEPHEGVLHPLLVVSVGEIVSSVSTARLLSVFGSNDCHLSLKEEVLELESLNEVGVPDVSAVGDADMLVHLRDILDLLDTLLEEILSTEDSSVALHGLLHGESDLGSGLCSLGVSDFIKLGNGLLSSVLGELLLGLARLEVLDCGVGGTTSKDNQVK